MFHENNEVMEYFTLKADTRMSHGSSVFFFFFYSLPWLGLENQYIHQLLFHVLHFLQSQELL